MKQSRVEELRSYYEIPLSFSDEEIMEAFNGTLSESAYNLNESVRELFKALTDSLSNLRG